MKKTIITTNGGLLTKTDASGATTYNYDVLDNLIPVILPSGTTIEYLVDGENTCRIISDHLGSPRLVVETATSAVIQTMNFDEFGRVIADTNSGKDYFLLNFPFRGGCDAQESIE